MKYNCNKCGAPAKSVRGTYDFKESGVIGQVKLLGIEMIVCDECNEQEPVIPNINALMKALALAVIRKPYRLMGEDVRFLRKYLHMTQEDFSRYLHVSKTHVSKWETNADKIGDSNDRLIRVVVLALGDGLKEELSELVKRFPEIRSDFHKFGINIDAETLESHYV